MKINLKMKVPGPKSQALMVNRIKHVARGPFHTTPLFAAKAEGAFIEDVDGNIFLDLSSGIGVVNVGHSPAKTVKAIFEQAQNFLHTSFNVVAYEGYVQVCDKLNQKTPGNFAKKSFLANSGAEAVENAIKIARTYTKKTAVICFEHAYHGRTYMAMGLTAKDKPYKMGFGPFCSDIYRAPFPYVYRWPTEEDTETISKKCFEEFKNLIQSKVGAAKVAAVIIEPVLGEGGFLPAPSSFLRSLRQFCDENNTILIFDEVQTGFGRTGTLFASEQLGVVADLLVSAKGIAAGLPLAAVTGRADIMDAPMEGGIGGTFGGNPIACAAALSVFELFEDGKLLANAKALGETLLLRLTQWKEKFQVIGEVRGLGLMLAVEFVKDRKSKEPNPEAAKSLVKKAYEKGVILMNAGTYGNVIRFLPPLCLETASLNEGLDVLEQLLTEL